ncbi:MAG TPA: AMP-binding protein, partial [Thermoanaerobaculia bacterium]
ILNRLLWMQRTLPLRAGDRVALKTPLSFDASIWEVFVPLLAGATVVVARPGGHQESAYLVELVARQEVTVLQLVPSMLRVLLEEPALPSCKRLSRVFSGGEELPAHVKERFFALLDAELHNLYGPTETAIDAAHWPCRPDPAERSVPVGRPIANVRIHLLDARLNPVPVGAVGELHIAGAGLARGYLGRPELSAERFIPNPFALDPGERLYKTGDLARYRPGGAIEYLGRRDHQVKVRGFRIELGEIEAALQKIPGVAQAVVLVRPVVDSAQIVAYVVPSGEAGPQPNGLRAALREVLPEPMIPAAFVLLAALPLTPNGKLDRAALPEPELVSSASQAELRGPTQELLASIWADLLGRERVGAHDNFFELGGHSLLATRLISRVRAAFQVEVSLRRFFDDATIVRLAALIEEERAAARPAAPPILPVRRDRELPLSFAQQRLWLIDQLQPGGAEYNLAMPLRIAGRLDLELLGRVLSEVVRRHEVLRTRFPVNEGRGAQVIEPPKPVWPPLVDLSALPAPAGSAEALRLAGEEARRPFDLGRDELLRCALLRLKAGADDHAVLFSLHHIVSDGWSTGVLVGEVMALYEAFAAGRPSPLPELPVQYADFAVWQREWLRGEVLEEQISYWRHQLAGAPQVLALPLDRPRPARQSFRGAGRSVVLPAELSTAVRELCRRESATPFMVLLAAWGLLLGRHANQPDLLVGSPIAGRNRQEIESLIGFFVNTLVLRIGLSGSPSFVDLVGRVRAAALDAYAHQDVPFERLVEEIATDRSLALSPLFQAVFALQNAPVQALSIAGLTLSPLVVEKGIAKLDLTLRLGEGGGGAFAGDVEYSTDLLDRSTVDRLLEHFETLLSGVLSDPGARVWEVPLLGEAERGQLLSWSGAGEVYPLTGSLHGRFEARAAERPEAAAVAFEGTSLSYGELDRRANRLANRLLASGVAPGSRVCLAVERGLGLVAGIVGILKAGCAYVPLDPSYPAERLAWVLEDAGAAALVSEAEMLERLPSWPGRVLLLEEEGGLEESPRVAVSPDWPAYVIYTSGSTGRPKGVVVSHGNVLRLLDSTAAWFGFGEADVWTLFHSFAFDFSVWELWGALLYGGRLVVVPYLVSRSPEAMLELVER